MLASLVLFGCRKDIKPSNEEHVDFSSFEGEFLVNVSQEFVNTSGIDTISYAYDKVSEIKLIDDTLKFFGFLFPVSSYSENSFTGIINNTYYTGIFLSFDSTVNQVELIANHPYGGVSDPQEILQISGIRSNLQPTLEDGLGHSYNSELQGEYYLRYTLDAFTSINTTHDTIWDTFYVEMPNSLLINGTSEFNYGFHSYFKQNLTFSTGWIYDVFWANDSLNLYKSSLYYPFYETRQFIGVKIN